MNTVFRFCLSALLLPLAFSVSQMATAAPEGDTLPPLGAHPFPKGDMPLPPPIPPLYEASMQTNQPAQALGKLVANVPQTADKNYEVRVMVRELLPKPPLPEKGEKPAKQ